MSNNRTSPLAATLTRKEAAAYLGLKPSTLATYASTGHGPKFVKLNTGTVLYPQAYLDEYLEDQGLPAELWTTTARERHLTPVV